MKFTEFFFRQGEAAKRLTIFAEKNEGSEFFFRQGEAYEIGFTFFSRFSPLREKAKRGRLRTKMKNFAVKNIRNGKVRRPERHVKNRRCLWKIVR